MGSYILRNVRPAALQNWIKVNAAGSLKSTPRESYRAFLQANGGVGATWSDLEASFLAAAGKTGGTIADRWAGQLAGLGTGYERARGQYK